MLDKKPNIFKSFKFRLYPTKEQEVLLSKHFGCRRFVYNLGLEIANKQFQESKARFDSYKLVKEIALKSKTTEFSFLRETNSQSLQCAIWDLDTAYSKFFRKESAFPKFKSKHKSSDSFCVPQHFSLSPEQSSIKIPKFKKPISCVFHRPIEGTAKHLTVSRNKAGQYFVSVTCETTKPFPEKKPVDSSTALAIDLGLTHFLTDSNGNKVDNPRWFRKSELKLKKAQRLLSKKKKDSKNRDKQRKRVAKLHLKISNQRKDFQHKLSFKLVKENQTLIFEDLSVSNMVKNHSLAKSIGDASWAQFVGFCQYKADWYGKNIIKIGRFEPSSKMCSCGKINNRLSLSDRTWTCGCGLTHDRDILAARNIKKFGLNRINLIGQELPRKPVERTKRNRNISKVGLVEAGSR